jgi:hypothetical protein
MVMANTPPVIHRFVLILFALVVSACGHEIGDACSTNVDCAQDGTRDCDLSQPGGYCTVTGCDEYSCPSGSVCIRIFPFESATQSCGGDGDCDSNSLCLPDGVCAPRVSERRFCERKCGSNDDCRGGYICREAGVEGKKPTSSTYGTIALVPSPNDKTVVKFCAPAL